MNFFFLGGLVNCLKRGAWIVCRFNLAKEGVMFLRLGGGGGVETQMRTMSRRSLLIDKIYKANNI